MRNEELAKLTRVGSQHRAEREVKRRLKPGVRGLAGSRDRVPCGFLGQSPKRSLRQSLNRRKPTKRCRKAKEETQTKEQNKAVSENKLCTAFSISLCKPTPQRAPAILRQ